MVYRKKSGYFRAAFVLMFKSGVMSLSQELILTRLGTCLFLSPDVFRGQIYKLESAW